ncbi:hypothetical protein Tco_1319452 [Tanacetum coccineum]
MVEEVTSLKKDFKQKENKYLEEFLDMKALKEKVEDKLFKQDQSLQTVHMLCKPKPYYDEQRKDVLKIKAKALKEQTKASRPIKVLMVYPPNTPATLFPRVFPTKKVILFFKTLKEYFEGIQKALTKEMKEIFEELEAEVDHNVVNRKYDEIERKNLLIENDNLIADCFSKEVFYIVTNSELNVSRFTEMHDAHTVVQARFLEHKAELSKLNDNDFKNMIHTELVIKHFSNHKLDDDENPEKEPEEEEEPIPEQAPAAPAWFAPQWIGWHDPNNNNGLLIEDDDDEEEIEAEDDKEEEEEDEVGGPSTAALELPFSVGRPFSVIVDSVVVHHKEIGGLSVGTENLEHALGGLTMKTGKVSDAQVEDSIAIGEIRLKINTLEGQVEVLANQHDLMINKVVEVESHVLKMKDRVNAHPCDQVVGLRGDVDRVLRLSQQVQALETTLQGTMSENQQLWTRLAESESRESTMIPYILWMEKRLTTLEERLQGPSRGPQ